VTKKELREGKNDLYLRLEFTDKTGPIAGNVWQHAQMMIEGYNIGDVVKVRGLVQNYKDQIQLNVKKIRKADANEYEINDFIPSTKKNIAALTDELFLYIESITHPSLKQLLLNIFEDKEIMAKFTRSPAAKNWHHNYIGGLLEHTIAVVRICDFASKHYPSNRDELITGAILHDFGKIYEYETLPTIDFTDEGRLLGHIVICDQLICKKANEINLFPTQTLMKLRHLILAHHGEMEKGAVKVPQTIEAIILHFADNLDAQTTGVQQIVEAVNNPNARWSNFDNLNNRYIFLGSPTDG
jgi:3'-5' exoribonuclease